MADDDEFAIVEAPERAVTRHGKGRPMKAFLHKKWGTSYAGQVLTGVEKGSIPADVAEFYEDDEPTPNDVVKDVDQTGAHPLSAKDDSIRVEKVREVAKEQKSKVEAAQKANDDASEAAARVAEDTEFTQRQAREADLLAAKRVKSGAKGKKLSPKERKKAEAGKAHTIK
jgi:hypothetical protein